jgi:hypothetical protein
MILIVGVTSMIGCVVAIVTRNWSALPLQLIYTALAGAFVAFRYRDRVRSRAISIEGAQGPLTGVYGLRLLTATFAVTLGMFGVVIAATPNLANGPVFPWVPVVALIAIITVLPVRTTARPLDCSSPRALAVSYRTRFFLRVAFAVSPALCAFCIAYIGAPIWTYYATLAFSLFQLATAVLPTRASLARDQAKLDSAGCHLSLVDALNATPDRLSE